jgi:hypothetical protein
MKKSLVVVLSLSLLQGCDKVKTQYATLADAHASGAFERGWLPPSLPVGTTNIVEINNVDANAGKGTFDYPAISTTDYLRLMGTGHNATVIKSVLGTYVVCSNATSHWSIHLGDGKGTYTVEAKEGRTQQSSVQVTRGTPPAKAGAAPESPVR